MTDSIAPNRGTPFPVKHCCTVPIRGLMTQPLLLTRSADTNDTVAPLSTNAMTHSPSNLHGVHNPAKLETSLSSVTPLQFDPADNSSLGESMLSVVFPTLLVILFS